MSRELVVASTTDSEAEVNRVANIGGVAEAPEPEVSEGEEAAPESADETVAPGAQEGAEAVVSAPAEEPKPGKSAVQKRFDKLTRQNYDTLEQLKAAKAEIESLKQRPAQEAAPAPKEETPAPKAPEKPTPDQFSTYEEYGEALADWKFDQKFAARLQEQQQQEAAAAAQRQYNEAAAAYNERMEESRARHDDFDKVLEKAPADLPPIHPFVRETLLRLEEGPEIAYHLAKHPQLARQILAADPATGVAAITKLVKELSLPAASNEEETTESRPAAKKGPDVHPVSSAPAPIRPVGGSSTKSSVSMDSEKVPYQDFKRWRNESIKNKYR